MSLIPAYHFQLKGPGERMPIVHALLSALVNAVLLVVIPFAGYFMFHRSRHKRSFQEIAERAGLQRGEPIYLLYGAGISLCVVLALLFLTPDLEALTRKGSAQHEFVGVGIGLQGILLALIYSVLKTGFCEEFLFRGLIAGSLARRMGLLWGNLLQAVIFTAPHLLVLTIMPELKAMIAMIFPFALLSGWLRIRSGSILAPWLMHAAANATTCLIVAANTSSA
ncbi:MAG: CPBP family intramembrane glutamic endopeptidase [bacterium]